jgi:hypothetical protein
VPCRDSAAKSCGGAGRVWGGVRGPGGGSGGPDRPALRRSAGNPHPRPAFMVRPAAGPGPRACRGPGGAGTGTRDAGRGCEEQGCVRARWGEDAAWGWNFHVRGGAKAAKPACPCPCPCLCPAPAPRPWLELRGVGRGGRRGRRNSRPWRRACAPCITPWCSARSPHPQHARAHTRPQHARAHTHAQRARARTARTARTRARARTARWRACACLTCVGPASLHQRPAPAPGRARPGGRAGSPGGVWS